MRLALWPHPLVFDYGLAIVTTPTPLLLPALGVAGLVGAVTFALRRNSPLGYLGLWFLALPTPTSSVVPVATQTMAEHRLYLPLAAFAVAFVLTLHCLLPRRELAVVTIIAVACGAATAARNQTYRTEISLWADTIAKIPTNARAHHNLAILLFPAGRTDEALAHFASALRLRPHYPEAHTNLGFAYLQLGRTAEAIQHTTTALTLQINQPEAHHIRGLALRQLGRTAEAQADFSAAVRLKPDHAAARLNLAIELLEAGNLTAAIAELETTVCLCPGLAAVHNTLGVALMRAGRLDDAAAHYATALRLQPDLTAARDNLALVRARLAAATAK